MLSSQASLYISHWPIRETTFIKVTGNADENVKRKVASLVAVFVSVAALQLQVLRITTLLSLLNVCVCVCLSRHQAPVFGDDWLPQLSPRPAEPGAQLHQERGLDDLWPRSHREYQRGGGSGECVLFCSNYYRLLLCAPGAINSQPGDSSQNIFRITLWWLG
jgi:hypothetical protein